VISEIDDCARTVAVGIGKQANFPPQVYATEICLDLSFTVKSDTFATPEIENKQQRMSREQSLIIIAYPACNTNKLNEETNEKRKSVLCLYINLYSTLFSLTMFNPHN